MRKFIRGIRDLLERIIQKGSDPSRTNAFLEAAAEDDVDRLRRFVEEEEMDIDSYKAAGKKRGKSALLAAIWDRRNQANKAVAYLLERGAAIKPKYYVDDDPGDTIMHHAAWRNNPTALTMLLNMGMSPLVENDKGRKPVYWSKQNENSTVDMLEEAEQNWTDRMKRVNLLFASISENKLDSKLADETTLNFHLWKGSEKERALNPLMFACYSATNGVQLGTVKALISLMEQGEHKVSINQQGPVHRNTALHFAILSKKKNVATLLLKKGANFKVDKFTLASRGQPPGGGLSKRILWRCSKESMVRIGSFGLSLTSFFNSDRSELVMRVSWSRASALINTTNTKAKENVVMNFSITTGSTPLQRYAHHTH